jgi:hypothetical protein
MKSRVSSVQPKANFYDGQKITESDLDAEQLHNQSIAGGIINDFHGSGIVRDSLFESNILLNTSSPGIYATEQDPNLSKETILLGRYDGLPIRLDLQPSDRSYGNRLEVELVNAQVGGKIQTKVLILGFAFSSLSDRGDLVCEVLSFDKNQTLISKYYYKEILSVIFNNFSGGTGKTEYYSEKDSLNVISNSSGYLVIRESEPLKVFPKTSTNEQVESPNFDLNSFITSDVGTSIEDLLREAVGDDVNFSDLYFELDSARIVSFEKNGSVTKSYGQKFLSKSNNLQKIDLLLSVSPDTTLPIEEQLDFSGELTISVHKLQTDINCPSDLVPDRLLDFDPEIDPIIEISFNQNDLQILGYSLTEAPQVVSFNLASTLIADPNIDPSLVEGQYYAILISRRGDTRTGSVNLHIGWDKPTKKSENGQILTPEEKFLKQSTRFFEFDTSTKRYVDYSSLSLWHKIHSDCVEITPGTAYSDDSFLISIPKTEKFVGETEISRYIDGISLANVAFGSSNYIILSHIQSFINPTTHPRTGNVAYSRIFDTGEIAVYNETDFLNLKENKPLLLAKVSDKNVRSGSQIVQSVNLPGLIDRDYITVINPDSSLLTNNLVGRLLTPDVSCECNKKYKIIRTECISYMAGDLDNDKKLTNLDISEIVPVLGNTINSSATEKEILSGNLSIIKFKQSDLNGDDTVDGEDLSLLEDAVDGSVSFSVPESFRILKVYIQNDFDSNDYPSILDDVSVTVTTTTGGNTISFTISDYRIGMAIRIGDVVSLSGTIDSGIYLISGKTIDSSGLNISLDLKLEDQSLPSFFGESGVSIAIVSGTSANMLADNLNLVKLPFQNSNLSIDFIESPFLQSNLEICDLRRYVSRNFIDEKILNQCVCIEDGCAETITCTPVFKNQQYVSGDMYIPSGEIYSSPGVPYHGDFEYATVSVSLPPGSLDDCQIDLYNAFVKSEAGTCYTAAGYPAMKYSDGTYVGCEDSVGLTDIQKGRVKFSSAIASLYVDSLVSGPIPDGYVNSSVDGASTTTAKNIVSESFKDQTFSEFTGWTTDGITDTSIFSASFGSSLDLSFTTQYISSSGTERYGLYSPVTFSDLTGDFQVDFTMSRYVWPTSYTYGGVHVVTRLDVSNGDGTTAELRFGWKQYATSEVKLFWSGIIRDSGSAVISTFEYSIAAPDEVGDDLLFRITRVDDTFFAYYINPSAVSETVDFGQFVRIGENPTVQPGNGSVSIHFESKLETLTTAGINYNVLLKEIVLRDIFSSDLSTSSEFTLSRDVSSNEISRIALSFPIEITPKTNIISAKMKLTAASNVLSTDSFNIIPLQIINAANLLPGYNYPYIQDTSVITSFIPGSLSAGMTFEVDITNIVIKFLSDPGFLPGYYKALVIEPDLDVGVNSSVILSSSVEFEILYEEITTGVIFKIGISIDPTTGIASFKTKNILYDSLNSENRTTIKFGVYLKKSGFRNQDITLGINELKKVGLGSCYDPNLIPDEGSECYFVVSTTGVGTFVEGPFDCAFKLP